MSLAAFLLFTSIIPPPFRILLIAPYPRHMIDPLHSPLSVLYTNPSSPPKSLLHGVSNTLIFDIDRYADRAQQMEDSYQHSFTISSGSANAHIGYLCLRSRSGQDDGGIHIRPFHCGLGPPSFIFTHLITQLLPSSSATADINRYFAYNDQVSTLSSLHRQMRREADLTLSPPVVDWFATSSTLSLIFMAWHTWNYDRWR